MYTMPDTPITVTFIEKPASEQYAPLYYDATGGSGPMASLNAGNSQTLDVGGGGINHGFSLALQAQNWERYKTRHEDLLAQYQANGTLSATYDDGDPTRFCFVYADKPVTHIAGSHDGLCFVDVFADRLCPHGNPNNAAMLYAAPPDGPNYADTSAFLAAIRTTAGNIATAMGRYNAAAASHGIAKIGVLRLCLYSSGIYNPNGADLNEIARNIYDGLHDVLKADTCGLTELEFPYSTDPADPLFAAVRSKFVGA